MKLSIKLPLALLCCILGASVHAADESWLQKQARLAKEKLKEQSEIAARKMRNTAKDVTQYANKAKDAATNILNDKIYSPLIKPTLSDFKHDLKLYAFIDLYLGQYNTWLEEQKNSPEKYTNDEIAETVLTEIKPSLLNILKRCSQNAIDKKLINANGAKADKLSEYAQEEAMQIAQQYIASDVGKTLEERRNKYVNPFVNYNDRMDWGAKDGVGPSEKESQDAYDRHLQMFMKDRQQFE